MAKLYFAKSPGIHQKIWLESVRFVFTFAMMILHSRAKGRSLAFRMFAPLLVASVLAGCSAIKGEKTDKRGAAEEKKEKDAAEKTEDASAVDVGFLLSMTFEEARKINPKSMSIDPYYKVAADEVTVVSQKKDGTPRRVRAKGHVFLQVDFREELRALGQEALISADEVILRGKPLLKRGGTVVEGLEDTTVFFIQGTRLQVIGRHRLTRGPAEVTPQWRGSWKEGPNPLLPALSPEDVPKEMRATPLLPLPSGDDLPKVPQ